MATFLPPPFLSALWFFLTFCPHPPNPVHHPVTSYSGHMSMAAAALEHSAMTSPSSSLLSHLTSHHSSQAEPGQGDRRLIEEQQGQWKERSDSRVLRKVWLGKTSNRIWGEGGVLCCCWETEKKGSWEDIGTMAHLSLCNIAEVFLSVRTVTCAQAIFFSLEFPCLTCLRACIFSLELSSLNHYIDRKGRFLHSY